MSESTLTSIEQKDIEFYGDQLIAIRADDGHVYVSVRHMCEALGIARQGQIKRIGRHSVLSKGMKGGNVLLPPSPSGRGGGIQRTNLLRVDLVPLWLSGLRVNAIKEELRPKLERFQVEASKVLWEAFQEGRLTASPSLDDLLTQDTDAVQAYKMAMAVAKIARQQILLDVRVNDHENRLAYLEGEMGKPDRAITRSQAMELSQAVKTVALALGKRSGRNEFGGVYGELYRSFEITSYKEMPANKFDNALEFLTEWHQSLVDDVIF